MPRLRSRESSASINVRDDRPISGTRKARYRSRRPAVTMQPTALAVPGNNENSSTSSTDSPPATQGAIPKSSPMDANAAPINSCEVLGVPLLSPRM